MHCLPPSRQVPYFKYKIGIDPLIGLVPVVGDCAGLVIGSVVIAIACNYHVPKRTITLMLGNQVRDVIGRHGNSRGREAIGRRGLVFESLHGRWRPASIYTFIHVFASLALQSGH
jgi:hypothetical protein